MKASSSAWTDKDVQGCSFSPRLVVPLPGLRDRPRVDEANQREPQLLAGTADPGSEISRPGPVAGVLEGGENRPGVGLAARGGLGRHASVAAVEGEDAPAGEGGSLDRDERGPAP